MPGHEQEIFTKLLACFREHHAMLGRGFNELSCCLRAGDSVGAGRAARQIYEEAGPHICFEEEDFYPALVPLLGGLEVIPRRRVEYRGRWLTELDLDAVLARRPKIVLVDELAHTNASPALRDSNGLRYYPNRGSLRSLEAPATA